MRKFHPSNARRRMPRMNNDHVNLCSEETNAENNAGLVVHLYRIVPYMHSTVLSALYVCIKSAIEIRLRKQEPCFPNSRKTSTHRCGYFEVNPQAYSFWLSISCIIMYALVSAFARVIIPEDNNRRRQGKL
jgi:hypothetical protein